jgi:hypothetical protein
MRRSWLIALSMTAVTVLVADPLRAQGTRLPNEPTDLVLMHHDSATRLTLTPDAVVFEYTARGVERERQHMDSVTATYADRAMATLVRNSVVESFRVLSGRYVIRDIASAQAIGATLVLTFKTASRANADEHSFDFDADDSGAARAFAERVNRLVSQH